jgi:hypothetical protein
VSRVTTTDDAEIFLKNWGPKDAQPIMFHHGWRLSSDDWNAQMQFFLSKGYRVVAHDRRGRGRSSQVWDGHDMDHYAADASAVVQHLDLKNAVHIGHSTGGGEFVPIDGSARLSAPLLKNGTLKTYPAYGHGLLTVNTDVLNADLLAFIQA